MRTRDPSYERSVRRKRGEVAARRAGSRGPKVYDAQGNDVTAPEIQFVGATVSGDDDELAVVTISGTGAQVTNDSGADLEYGMVVVRQSDGSVTTTTTERDTRPVGVIQVGGADGTPVSVVFQGDVEQINTIGTVAAGDYLETSTTAGKAQSSGAVRRSGSFGTARDADPDPPAFLFGIPDSTSAPASGTGEFLLKAGGEEHDIAVNSASGSAATLDISTANYFDITLTGNCALTFTNPPASGKLGQILVVLRQDGMGSRTVTWPASVVWQSATGTATSTAPTLFTAAGAVDAVLLSTLDGGGSWGASRLSGSAATSLSSSVFATPAIVHGTAAAAGAASTTIRSDATIVTFDATAPVTQAFGDTAATGSAAVAARRDHKHGMPSAPTTGQHILLADGHATPFTFNDLLQMDDGSDFMWSDP